MIGHEYIRNSLIMAIDNNKLSHAHVLAGEDGIGKGPLARDIAVRILGKDEDRDYVDIVEVRLDNKRQSIGVETVRKLIEEANKKPFEQSRKVIIIHNSDKMTEQAQNALLKTIEEPPKNVYMFLLCENVDKILQTIKSRCQVHKLTRLSKDEMQRYVNDNYKDADHEKLAVALAFSEGIPGKVDTILSEPEFCNMRDQVIDVLVNVNNISSNDLSNYEKLFMKYGNLWNDIINIYIMIIRDAIIYKEVGNNNLIINVDKMEEIKKLVGSFSLDKLNTIINIINDTRSELVRNVSVKLVFMMMLLKIQEV